MINLARVILAISLWRIVSAARSEDAARIDAAHSRIVKDALRIAWSHNHDLRKLAAHEIELTLSTGMKCFVDPLPDINGEKMLGRVRKQWQEQFPGDFMGSPRDVKEDTAEGLVAKFSKLSSVTEGSKSGSLIYTSDGSQLFLKSEGSNELNVFHKKSPDTGNAFIADYVDRVVGDDVETDRDCQRSTLMRYLLVFSMHCPSKGSKDVWMLFANISPLAEVPLPLHKFDLKASRGMEDCHAEAWEPSNRKQGYLGDFLSLYKDLLDEEGCSAQRLRFHNSSRKICFMKALHKDLRLLGRYKLIDYSFYATVHEYRSDIDEDALQTYNNLLSVSVNGEMKVMTIGTIDLLKDWDAEWKIRSQNVFGFAKFNAEMLYGGKSLFTETLFGQRKFDSYPYYLYCLAVDLLDPVCEGERSLQLLSECPKGDDLNIYFPEAKEGFMKWETEEGENLLNKYLMGSTYCELVNSCNVLVALPDSSRQLGICKTHACKILGFKRCPLDLDHQGDGREGGKTGENKMWRIMVQKVKEKGGKRGKRKGGRGREQEK